MSNGLVGVVDYGVGNLRSVANALREVGATPCISSDHAELATCPRLILPGVGAFGEGMKALRATGLDGFLKGAVAEGTELLGICLGMQMLAQSSTEFGTTEGLGILPGDIRRLDEGRPGNALRLPNVGWLPLEPRSGATGLVERLFEGVSFDARYYFIHSYAATEQNPVAAAISQYEDIRFASIVARDNIVGTQFHPEKSGAAGLRILKNFAC